MEEKQLMFRITNGENFLVSASANELASYASVGVEYVVPLTTLMVPAKLGPWTVLIEGEVYQDARLMELVSGAMEYAPQILKHSTLSTEEKINHLLDVVKCIEVGFYELGMPTANGTDDPKGFVNQLLDMNLKQGKAGTTVPDWIVIQSIQMGVQGLAGCYLAGKRKHTFNTNRSN